MIDVELLRNIHGNATFVKIALAEMENPHFSYA